MRRALLAVSRDTRLRYLVERSSSRMVDRFVAGEAADDALRVTKALIDAGLTVTIDYLGEDVVHRADAFATVRAYERLLNGLGGLGYGGRAEVSIKLSALGQSIDEKLALDQARLICDAARRAGTTVTVDMEDHTTTDRTLAAVGELRTDFPWVGAVLQAYLRRTEGDCQDLATSGSRVRLCKGAYKEPPSVAFQGKAQVRSNYIRCLAVLMTSECYPMIASHDPVVLRAALAYERPCELQMLLGVRQDEQRRLAEAGHSVRVYVPFGRDWYGYFSRRLAERPANVAFFLRALAGS